MALGLGSGLQDLWRVGRATQPRDEARTEHLYADTETSETQHETGVLRGLAHLGRRWLVAGCVARKRILDESGKGRAGDGSCRVALYVPQVGLLVFFDVVPRQVIAHGRQLLCEKRTHRCDARPVKARRLMHLHAGQIEYETALLTLE